VVCFGSTSVAANDKFLELFEDTFRCSLDAATPERVAFRALQPSGKERALENLDPFHLIPRPRSDEDTSDEPVRSGMGFLGREFLTWLWFKTDTAESGLRLRGGDEVTVMLDKSMRLACDFQLSGTAVLTGDGVATFPEGRAALPTGKQPTKVGLVIGGAVGEFAFALDGPSLAVSSLALPEDKAQERDPLVRLERRFERTVDLTQLLDGLFELFLEQRLGRDWPREARAITQWASRGAASRAPALALNA
jgi:hypothetical protein